MGFYDTTEQPHTHGHRLKTAYPRLDFVESGYRYYNSAIGRWANRDPIEEDGGLLLYGFVGNEPLGMWDLFGLVTEKGYAYIGFGHPMGHIRPEYVEAWIKVYADLKAMLDAYTKGGAKQSLLKGTTCCNIKVQSMMPQKDFVPSLINYRETFFFGHAVPRGMLNPDYKPNTGMDVNLTHLQSFALIFGDGTADPLAFEDRIRQDPAFKLNWKNTVEVMASDGRFSKHGATQKYDANTGVAKLDAPKDKESAVKFAIAHFYPYTCFDGLVAKQMAGAVEKMQDRYPNLKIIPPFGKEKPNQTYFLGRDMVNRLEGMLKKDCSEVKVVYK